MISFFCKHVVPSGAIGLAVGLYGALLIGAVLGGILQVAPCHGGAAHRSFFENTAGGVVFGVLLALVYLAGPAAAVGLVIGSIWGAVLAFLRNRQSTDPAVFAHEDTATSTTRTEGFHSRHSYEDLS